MLLSKRFISTVNVYELILPYLLLIDFEHIVKRFNYRSLAPFAMEDLVCFHYESSVADKNGIIFTF